MLILIDEEPDAALPIRDALRRLRVHSFTLKPIDIHRIAAYCVHGILIPRPERITNLRALCEALQSRYPVLPLAILFREGDGYYEYLPLCDLLIEEENTKPRETVDRIFAIYAERTAKRIHKYMIGDIRTELHQRYIIIDATPMKINTPQWLLVRYLQMAHPRPVPAQELLDVCFSHRPQMNINNVTTQIYRFNRAMRFYFKRAGIVFRRGEGYAINTDY